MRITSLLWLAFGLIFLASLSENIISLQSIRELDKEFEDVAGNLGPLSSSAYEMEINAVGAGLGVLNYLQRPDPDFHDRFIKDQKNFESFLDQFFQLDADKRYGHLGEEVVVLYARYKSVGETLVRTRNELQGALRDLELIWQEFESPVDGGAIAENPVEPNSGRPDPLHTGLKAHFSALLLMLATWDPSRHEDPGVAIGQNEEQARRFLERTIGPASAPDPSGRIGRARSSVESVIATIDRIQELRRSIDQNLIEFSSLRSRIGHLLDEKIQILIHRDLVEDQRKFAGNISRTQVELAMIALISLILALLGIMMIKRRILHPIAALVDGAEAFGKGELTHKVRLRAGDEFSTLAVAFNRMVDSLRVASDKLEARVARRTSELRGANLQLEKELAHRISLEQQLIHAQKLESLGTLAGGIAHDFNNMLYVILGFSKLALSDVPPDGPANQALSRILQAAERSQLIVNQILCFSRQEVADRTAHPFDLVAKDAVALLSSVLPSTHRFVTNIEDGCGTVLSDEMQMHQLIINLVTNAYQADDTGKGTTRLNVCSVEIDEEKAIGLVGLMPGPHIQVSVTDNGCGIHYNDLARIFDPFFTTKPVGEGTGLGLSVVHGIVVSHKGAITVSSEVGRGTTFEIYLPRCSAGATSTVAPRETPLDRQLRLVIR